MNLHGMFRADPKFSLKIIFIRGTGLIANPVHRLIETKSTIENNFKIIPNEKFGIGILQRV